MTKSEDRILSDFHLWMWENYPDLRRLCFHPNNEADLGPVVGAINKSKGVVSGVADYICLVRGGGGQPGLCIEFKVPGGVLRPHQVTFAERVQEQGYEYRVAYSTEQAIEIWKEYHS